MATRSDALEKRLGYSDAVKLRAAILDGMSFRDAVEWCELEFEVATSIGAMSGFNERFVAPYIHEGLKQSAELAASLASVLSGIDDAESVFEDASVSRIEQRVFELLANPKSDPKETALFVKAFLKLRDQKSDDRRLVLLEQQVSDARTAKEALEVGTDADGGLTPEGLAKVREALKRI